MEEWRQVADVVRRWASSVVEVDTICRAKLPFQIRGALFFLVQHMISFLNQVKSHLTGHDVLNLVSSSRSVSVSA